VFPIVSAPLRRIVIAFGVVNIDRADRLAPVESVPRDAVKPGGLDADRMFGAYMPSDSPFRASKIDDDTSMRLSAHICCGIFLGNLYLVLDSSARLVAREWL